jgi:hypothetical protein
MHVQHLPVAAAAFLSKRPMQLEWQTVHAPWSYRELHIYAIKHCGTAAGLGCQRLVQELQVILCCSRAVLALGR